jgi:diacylglycerol kinase (ATP)
MTTALVLGRRRRGRDIEGGMRETTDRLVAAGWTVEARIVDTKRQLRKRTKKAVRAGADVVVAVGGDGVVSQALQRLAETNVALGIVPMGTGNLMARNLEIPKARDEAISALLEGGSRRIDLGRVELEAGRHAGRKRHFAIACGVGFDAQVMQSTTKTAKAKLGRIAYFASVFRQSGKVRNFAHEVTVDGTSRSVMATQVLVANLGSIGFGLKPKLGIKGDDGVLDVIVLSARGPLDGLLAGWEALRQRRHGRSHGGRVIRSKGRDVRVTTRRPRLVEIDGSVIGTTPIRVSIRPSALTVLVPAPKASPSAEKAPADEQAQAEEPKAEGAKPKTMAPDDDRAASNGHGAAADDAAVVQGASEPEAAGAAAG